MCVFFFFCGQEKIFFLCVHTFYNCGLPSLLGLTKSVTHNGSWNAIFNFVHLWATLFSLPSSYIWYMYNHCIPCYGWKWSISAQIAFVHNQCPHSVLITWLFIMGMFATCFCGSHAPRLSRLQFLIACSTQKWRRFDVSDMDHMIKRLGPFSLC